jgi:hypothetical protein
VARGGEPLVTRGPVEMRQQAGHGSGEGPPALAGPVQARMRVPDCAHMASLLNGILQADHSPGTKAGNLELRRDALGWRHWLDGRPVYAGSELEIDFFQEGWIPARYHWRFEIDRRCRPDAVRGAAARPCRPPALAQAPPTPVRRGSAGRRPAGRRARRPPVEAARSWRSLARPRRVDRATGRVVALAVARPVLVVRTSRLRQREVQFVGHAGHSCAQGAHARSRSPVVETGPARRARRRGLAGTSGRRAPLAQAVRLMRWRPCARGFAVGQPSFTARGRQGGKDAGCLTTGRRRRLLPPRGALAISQPWTPGGPVLLALRDAAAASDFTFLALLDDRTHVLCRECLGVPRPSRATRVWPLTPPPRSGSSSAADPRLAAQSGSARRPLCGLLDRSGGRGRPSLGCAARATYMAFTSRSPGEGNAHASSRRRELPGPAEQVPRSAEPRQAAALPGSRRPDLGRAGGQVQRPPAAPRRRGLPANAGAAPDDRRATPQAPEPQGEAGPACRARGRRSGEEPSRGVGVGS